MPSSFSIRGSRCSLPFSPEVRDEIRERTGSDRETSSILRSIERFGGEGVWLYEMTPKAPRGTRHDTRAVTWNVHAVRV